MKIQGSVDRVTPSSVTGWVYDVENPSLRLTVALEHNSTTLASVSADRFRKDLREKGKGDGMYGFSLSIDSGGVVHDINDLVVLVSAPGSTERVELPLPRSLASDPPTQSTSADHVDSVKIRQLLRQGLFFAQSGEVYPPVGYPVDFIDSRDFSQHKLIQNWLLHARASEQEVKDAIRRDTVPIPHVNNREGYSPGFDLGYWIGGYAHYRKMQDEVAVRHGIKSGSYLDFGGSTGRIFRHFALQSTNWDVWSCDFKSSSVEYNLRYFPKTVRAFLNTSFPYLPLPDAQFNLITAYSVFTHINELELAWLLELRRLLKLGGLACLTIHNEETWLDMDGPLRQTVEKFRPEISGRKELPVGKTVATFRDDDPYNCNVFHSIDYIYQNWGRFFEICEIIPRYLGGQQAMVVCRRKS